ncbi:MAG TPA: Wzz/FepE/Etk N-terminal domain-containing protein, partial [Opitutaceae bacterium]|nr:Wzz/FepE/Etk N-terminal domain-containing protein [Opitutaceae bacterium]
MSEQVHSENHKDAPAEENASADDEVSLLDMLIVLAKHKRLVFGLPLAAGILPAIISLLLPNVYTATTR